jgi:hypothetical protein
MSVTLVNTRAPFVGCEQKCNQVQTVGTPVLRNANANMWHLWWVLAECAFRKSLDSGGLFFVGAFARNMASVALKVFSRLCCFKKKFYKCCTSNVNCRDNAGINCITVQHENVSYTSTLTGRTTLDLKYYLDVLCIKRPVKLIYRHFSP